MTAMMIVATLLSLSIILQTNPPDSTVTLNPFAAFETYHLPNGLTLWYKHLPDASVTSISVALPFGADQDPAGKEQLAHFTEHMLFSDQPGRSEEEIREEIESLGGVYNASVNPDRSFYYVRIGGGHASFALDWLHRILAPHAMDPEVVERQRQPIALETRARPRQFFDWIWAYYIDPPLLRLPDFWEREFGIKTLRSRDYYPYRSLQRIAAADLRWFYDTYYMPSTMTLTVIGDVDRELVRQKVAETFATLPVRPEPEIQRELRDPQRFRQSIFWVYRSNVYYVDRYKFYELTADEEIMLLFITRLLGKRLNDRLRFGQRKAAYGVAVGLVKRGGAAYMSVRGGLKPEEFDYAREVFAAELDGLRSGTLAPAEFAADRAAVTRQLSVTNAAPEDLEGWVSNHFYDSRVHESFPDLVAAFEAMTLESVQRFVGEHFVPERQVKTIIYPHPITQGLLFLLISTLVWLTVAGVRRAVIQPIDMSKIHYVARFRLPRLYLACGLAALLALVAVGGRVLVYGFQLLADGILVSFDSFWVQWIAYAMMLVLLVLLLLLILTRLPRKILLFEDHVLIKYLSYRGVRIPTADLEEVSLRGFKEIWLSRRLWRCLPLALGIVAPAVYLKRKGRRSRRAYFFQVRDRSEFLRVLVVVGQGMRTQTSDAGRQDGTVDPAGDRVS